MYIIKYQSRHDVNRGIINNSIVSCVNLIFVRVLFVDLDKTHYTFSKNKNTQLGMIFYSYYIVKIIEKNSTK